MKIAEEIRTGVEKFSKSFKVKIPVGISVSIGCASHIANNNLSSDEFLTHADKALYAAKNAGRNCICKADISIEKKEKAV